MNKPAIVLAALLAVLAMAAPVRATPHSGPASAAMTPPGATTFHFSNIPVRSALQLIAEQGNFNLVVSDSVKGTVSLHLTNVTWEQALDVVLKLKGLEQQVQGNTRSVSGARR